MTQQHYAARYNALGPVIPSMDPTFDPLAPENAGWQRPFNLHARVRIVRHPAEDTPFIRGLYGRIRSQERIAHTDDDGQTTRHWAYVVELIDPPINLPSTHVAAIALSVENDPYAHRPLYWLHHDELAEAPENGYEPELRDKDVQEEIEARIAGYVEQATTWRRSRLNPNTRFSGYVAYKRKPAEGAEDLRGDQVVVVYEPGIGDRRLRCVSERVDNPYRHTWGYEGAGPRELALTLLCAVYGERPTQQQLDHGESLAWMMAHDFKREVITPLPEIRTPNTLSWLLSSDAIARWIVGWIHMNPSQVTEWATRMAYAEDLEQERIAEESVRWEQEHTPKDER